MALTWLTYNGSTVGLASHAGYGLGFDSTPQPSPTPIAIDGTIRFQFGNTGISQPQLYELSGNHGTWAPVRDAVTGNEIPGMWDFNYNNVGGNTIEDVFLGRLSVQYLPDGVELVDIKDNHPPELGFWDDAFRDDTALTKATITQLNTTRISTMVHLFDGCTNLTEAHVEINSASTNTEVMFNGCTRLTKIYLKVPQGVSSNMYSSCTSLQELTVELTGTGWYLRDMHGNDFRYCLGSLTEVTFIHPYGVSARLTWDSQDQYNLFAGCTALKHVNHFVRVNQSDLEADPLPVSAYTYNMFKGCSSLMAIPQLDVLGVHNCSEMFYECRQVASGISAAYSALSAANPQLHRYTFHNCGVNTAAGSAELAEVPAEWK